MADKPVAAVPDLPTEEAEVGEWEYEIDKAVYEEPIPLDDDIFRPNGLNLDMTEVSYSEWARVVHTLSSLEQGIHWWGGDIYRFGDDKFGEEIGQVLTKHELGTYADWARTCDTFPTIEDRSYDLHYSHYKYVRAEDKRTRNRLLKKAVQDDWSTEDMRLAVKALKDPAPVDEDEGPTTSITWSSSFRLAPGDEDLGNQIAQRWTQALEEIVAEFGVNPLRIGSPDKEYNKGQADTDSEAA